MSTKRRFSTIAVAAALAAAGCGGDDAIEGTESDPEGQSPSLVDPAGNEPGSTSGVPEPDGR